MVLFIQYTNYTVLYAPSQRSNAKIYLSSGFASLQTFQETDTKICETSVYYCETESTPVYVTSCESCKQASNNDSILIPG